MVGFKSFGVLFISFVLSGGFIAGCKTAVGGQGLNSDADQVGSTSSTDTKASQLASGLAASNVAAIHIIFDAGVEPFTTQRTRVIDNPKAVNDFLGVMARTKHRPDYAAVGSFRDEVVLLGKDGHELGSFSVDASEPEYGKEFAVVFGKKRKKSVATPMQFDHSY